jgi:hypothetical protein
LPSGRIEIVSGSGTGSDATFLWQTNTHRPLRAFALALA